MGACLVDGCGRDALHRYACPACTERMRRHLREVDTYATILAASKTPGRTGTDVRRAPGFESRSPARDDVLVALDYRSRTSTDGRDDSPTPTRSLLGTLHGIASWMRDELDVTDRRRADPTVSGEIGWLLPRIDWAATQPWVDDLAADLAELHRQVRALAYDLPAAPFGRCLSPSCDGLVFPALVDDPDAPGGARVNGGRCAACARAYDWIATIRVRAARQEARP